MGCTRVHRVCMRAHSSALQITALAALGLSQRVAAGSSSAAVLPQAKLRLLEGQVADATHQASAHAARLSAAERSLAGGCNPKV